MATAVQKITLSSSRDIPFNKLVLSQSNVRRVKAGVSIEDLAEDIARRGLIQSLSVRPVVDADGGDRHVRGARRRPPLPRAGTAGGRSASPRPRRCPASCATRREVLAEEVSLAENIDRAPLHPLDQFRAFQDMRRRA
jgi:ParB family chromosome partitioning protein